MARFCVAGVSFLLAMLMGWMPAWSQEREQEAVSLLGRQLYRSTLGDQQKMLFEKNLAAAQSEYQANPQSPEALIWLGRRTAYLGRYNEAIAIFTEGIAKFPSDPRFYRHRGHRFISVRRFGAAIADLSRAAALSQGQADEIEPDGLPNARNQPTSTTQSNIWYHLGLAHYLRGDFEAALESYRECRKVSRNDDMRVASSHWLYMILRRLGDEEAAAAVLEPIHPEMDIIENHSYHDLLLLYKGLKKPEEIYSPEEDNLASATAGYGVGNWHLYNGRRHQAFEIFERILAGGQWASFGYLAAEAEVARNPR